VVVNVGDNGAAYRPRFPPPALIVDISKEDNRPVYFVVAWYYDREDSMKQASQWPKAARQAIADWPVGTNYVPSNRFQSLSPDVIRQLDRRHSDLYSRSSGWCLNFAQNALQQIPDIAATSDLHRALNRPRYTGMSLDSLPYDVLRPIVDYALSHKYSSDHHVKLSGAKKYSDGEGVQQRRSRGDPPHLYTPAVLGAVSKNMHAVAVESFYSKNVLDVEVGVKGSCDTFNEWQAMLADGFSAPNLHLFSQFWVEVNLLPNDQREDITLLIHRIANIIQDLEHVTQVDVHIKCIAYPACGSRDLLYMQSDVAFRLLVDGMKLIAQVIRNKSDNPKILCVRWDSDLGENPPLVHFLDKRLLRSAWEAVMANDLTAQPQYDACGCNRGRCAFRQDFGGGWRCWSR
jgi:hypothetical protein